MDQMFIIIGAVILTVVLIGLKLVSRSASSERDSQRGEIPRPAPRLPSLKHSSIHTEIITLEGVYSYSLTMVNDQPFLPSPLELGAHSASPHREPVFQDRVLLRVENFESINERLGCVFLAAPLKEKLEFLGRVCTMFAVKDRSFHCVVSYEGTSTGLLREVNLAMTWIAGQLLEMSQEPDTGLQCMIAVVLDDTDLAERRNGLRHLIALYRDSEATHQTLGHLKDAAEFDLAFPAAEALGLDLVQFTCHRVKFYSQTNRLKAIRKIVETRMPAGLAFLLDYYPEARIDSVKLGIIAAFGELAESRAEPLLLETLREGPAALIEDAVAALTACGGRESLGPLYAVTRDRSAPRSLRDAAAQAMAAIRDRVGPTETGRLSLAGNESGEGGLSKVERNEAPPDVDTFSGRS